MSLEMRPKRRKLVKQQVSDKEALDHVIPYEVIKDEDSGAEKIKCCYCCKLFNAVQEHKEHRCKRVNDFLLECVSCKIPYVDHYLNDNSERTSSGDENLVQGEKLAEPVKESPVTKSKYECCVCHKTYSDISFTIRHIKYHVHRKAAVAEPSLHCGQCGKGFATKQQLNKHETVHTDERPFKCEVCDKWFKTLDNVKRHMYVHNDEKPFACPTCGKEFKAKHMLKKHVETHNDSRLFECPQCEKKYKAKNSLRDHLRVHSGQRPYKCQQCDQAFYRPSHLATHKLVHSKLKPYSCKDCKKTFGRREHLKVHERIHSGEKPFKCMSCDRSFNQQAGLQAHLVSHSEERPHCCLKCNKTFKYQSQVKHHSCKPEDIELGMVGMNENRENKGTSGIDMDTTLAKTKTSMTGGNCGNERIMDGSSSQVSDSVPCLNTTNTIILIQIQNAPEGSVLDETTTGTQRIIGIQDGSKRSAGENGGVSQHCADVLVADQLAVGETSTVSEDQTQGIMVGIEEMIATELLEKI